PRRLRLQGQLDTAAASPAAVDGDRDAAVLRPAHRLDVIPVDVEQRGIQIHAAAAEGAVYPDLVVRGRIGIDQALVGQRADILLRLVHGLDALLDRVGAAD